MKDESYGDVWSLFSEIVKSYFRTLVDIRIDSAVAFGDDRAIE